ncbi:hypothetical protein BGZ46_008368 [Entomortierella lignicola]|nr:hypothetical protein BGZ46_008368 [Entomortierella lignicola]
MDHTIINPLELPEIRHALAKFLDRYDILKCILVSKSWYATFNPYIWSTINLYWNKIDPDVLSRNRHFVKDICFIHDISDQQKQIHFPNIQSLHISCRPHTDQDQYADFLDIHRQSITLFEFNIRFSPISQRLWESVLALPELKDLSLLDNHYGFNPIPRFWEVCSRIESLAMHPNFLPDKPLPNSLSSTAVFPRLKRLEFKLHFSDDIDRYWDIFTCFPNLVSFTCVRGLRDDDNIDINGFAKRMALGSWTWLQELTALGCQISDHNLALIISNMRQVKKLLVTGAEFGQLALEALRPHFPHLKELDISHPEIDMGLTIVEILKSCSQLEKLTAFRIMGSQITDRDIWGCKESLRTLQLGFSLAEAIPEKYEQQQLIFKKISELRNLERLDITNFEIPGTGPESTLDLRLEMGLGQLETLRNMRELVFNYTKQFINVEEVKWMLNRWPKLSSVQGVFNLDTDVDRDLKTMLHFRGIESY